MTSQELSVSKLQGWLRRKLGEDAGEVLGIERASNGFSAETVLLNWVSAQGGRREVVVRVEHPGQEIFLDTKIARQAEVMRALRRNGLQAPHVIDVETDATVLGRSFIAMDRLPGKSFPQRPNYNVGGWVKDLSPMQRGRLWENALSTLGRLNKLAPPDGFAFLDRPRFGTSGLDQYLGWLRAWCDASRGAEGHEIIQAGMAYLDDNRPKHIPVSFVWGDSNPCNMLFEDDLSVSAVLDFEASALGPAEIDLGWWFFLDRSRLGARAPLAGIPVREEAIAIYETALGRKTRAVDYFETMGGVRMCLVIVRTVDRLEEAGRIELGTDAGTANPIAATLARLLDMQAPEPGAGFARFTAAMAHS